MKIHKNPDGGNFDILYPTLFFGSFGFILYYAFKTCVNSNQFWGLALISVLIAYFIHYYVVNKKKAKVKAFGLSNLFIAMTMTPVIVAILLTLNYYVSFEMYHETSAIKGNIVTADDVIYIQHDNAPGLCAHLFSLPSVSEVYKYDSVETKINKGIIGLPVIKYHKYKKAKF